MSNREAWEKLLLWVFVASNDRIGELNHTYARTEIEARRQVNDWIAEQVMLGRKDIEVKHWPGGFMAGYRTYWPGSIPAQQKDGSEGQYADKQ